MKTIWKYELKIADRQEVRLPVGANALTVQLQGERPCLWVMVEDTAQRNETLLVWMHGTGHPATEAALLGRYLSTVQVSGLVFHFFVGK
jgi:hypothetical protein